MKKSVICGFLLLVGLVAGAAGIWFRVSGAVFFLVLWMVGVAALHHYWARR